MLVCQPSNTNVYSRVPFSVNSSNRLQNITSIKAGKGIVEINTEIGQSRRKAVKREKYNSTEFVGIEQATKIVIEQLEQGIEGQ
jgi:hypothetical protein